MATNEQNNPNLGIDTEKLMNHSEEKLEMDNNNNNKVETMGNNKQPLPEPLTKLSPPANTYFLDQMKNGLMIANHKITKNRLIIGRARDCDITMDHPTISRYHASLLWAPKNDQHFQDRTNTESFWYLIDCGSTHGTICNKQRIQAGKMIKITPNNNLFRFGASTRLFTLGSNEELRDSDDETCGEDIQFPKNKRQREEEAEDCDECTWGMSLTDCNDEIEESADNMALKSIIAALKDGQSCLQPSENENAFSENPYKCLQQWFEREGYDFDYKTDTFNNKFKCIFELPIDGQWIPVEGKLMTKKKEAISDACLRCCKLLDQASLLFSWQKKNSSSEKAKKEFYDDDDDLIDETVKVTKKFKKDDSITVDNYETLNAKWKEINSELCKLKVRLATIGLEPDVQPELPENLPEDSLDLYCATMNQKKYGLTINEKIEKSNLKIKIKQLEQEQTKIEKFIQIAKPVEIILKNSRLKTIDPNMKAKDDDLNSKNKKETKLQPVQRETIIKERPEKKLGTKDEDPKLRILSSKKHYKEQRRTRQESIIQAIEKEKQLEKEKAKNEQEKQSLIDGDFVDWVPPSNQTGDGRTHLNEKFGY